MLEDSLSEEEKDLLESVRCFVENERRRVGVNESQLGTGHRKEISCFAHGEFKNLLYRQLIYTKYGYGDWIGLNGDVLRELSEYIKNIKNYRNKQ